MRGLLILVKLLFLPFCFLTSIQADSCGGIVTKVITGDSFIAYGGYYRIDRIKAPDIKTEPGIKAKKELEKIILNKAVIGVRRMIDKDGYIICAVNHPDSKKITGSSFRLMLDEPLLKRKLVKKFKYYELNENDENKKEYDDWFKTN